MLNFNLMFFLFFSILQKLSVRLVEYRIMNLIYMCSYGYEISFHYLVDYIISLYNN